MASMWRRAMVYLGLQDDDELDYGGEYESYGDYGEPAEEPQTPRAPRPGRDDADGRATAPRESGTVRDPPRARDRLRRPTTAPPEPAPAPAPRPRPRPDAPARSRRACRRPRPSVVRTIGPTTAARVHVVEPQGFNDAQEVGDRLKANQPVILNLQGLPRELQRRLIDFSSGLAYAVAARCSASPTRCSCSRPATSRSPRRRRTGCRRGACSRPDPCATSSRIAASPSTSSSSPAGRCCPGSPCAAAPSWPRSTPSCSSSPSRSCGRSAGSSRRPGCSTCRS